MCGLCCCSALKEFGITTSRLKEKWLLSTKCMQNWLIENGRDRKE